MKAPVMPIKFRHSFDIGRYFSLVKDNHDGTLEVFETTEANQVSCGIRTGFVKKENLTVRYDEVIPVSD